MLKTISRQHRILMQRTKPKRRITRPKLSHKQKQLDDIASMAIGLGAHVHHARAGINPAHRRGYPTVVTSRGSATAREVGPIYTIGSLPRVAGQLDAAALDVRSAGLLKNKDTLKYNIVWVGEYKKNTNVKTQLRNGFDAPIGAPKPCCQRFGAPICA